MKIGIAGPIATENIARFLAGDSGRLPRGYLGAPLLATLIGALLARGHTVCAFTTSSDMPSSPSNRIVAEGERFSIHYCPQRRRAFRPSGGRLGRAADGYRMEREGLRQAMVSEAPDVVHAHWLYEFALAAIDSGLPHVITCHDAPGVVLRYKPNLYLLAHYLMSRTVLANARALTAVSPYMKDAIAASTQAPVSVVANPLPAGLLNRAPAPPALDRVRPRLVMVLHGWSTLKNAQTAFRAFALIRQRVPQAHLSVFGFDFEPAGKAHRWCRARGLAEGVEFVGSVPHAQLLRRLGKAHVLVHPSLEESFGMCVAEAMALGVPVVGGDRSGGVPWVLSGSGVLTDVTSAEAISRAVLRLLSEPGLHEACRRAGLERARGAFSPETVMSRYEEAYRTAADADHTAAQPRPGAAFSAGTRKWPCASKAKAEAP